MNTKKHAAVACAAASLALASSLAIAAVPTIADVGDPDSFGRPVKYLGVIQIPVVDFETDCTGAGPPDQVRCVTLNPQPAATTFADPDMALMNLPAKASNSLLCFHLTPFISYILRNFTATERDGSLRGSA